MARRRALVYHSLKMNGLPDCYTSLVITTVDNLSVFSDEFSSVWPRAIASDFSESSNT